MKDLTVAYLLWFFLGFFGAHKFYMNRIGMGIFYLFSYGGFFIGWFIDLFTLPKQVREANILLVAKMSNITEQVKEIKTKPKKLTQVEKEKIVLQIAKKYQGRVTPIEVATDSDLSIDESEELIKKLASRGYCEIKVTASGGIFYEFYGLLSEEEKNNSSGVI